MGAMAPSCDTLWRLRPEFSLSVRISGKQYARTAGRNSRMRFHAKGSSVHVLGSRMEDAYLLLRRFKLPTARENNTILKCHKSESLVSKRLSGDRIFRTGLYGNDNDTSIYKGSDFNGTFFQRDQPIEEPWLLQSSLLYHYAPHSGSSSYLADDDRIQQQDNSNYLETKSFMQSILNLLPDSRNVDVLSSKDKRHDPCESNQPIEEPWLFEFSLFLSSNPKVVSNNECVKEDATHPEVYDQLHQVTEHLFPEDKGSAISQKHSVSRVILINSSVCTMQRIAVLEDGELVELFLEPVENNIQCDSIYLGVFNNFDPHLGSAFINIGGKKRGFMAIKDDIEPFLFPPIRPHTKEQELDGSVFVMPEDIQNMSSGIEAEDEIDGVDIDDDALHDECTEDVIRDDTDIQEVQKENVNGSLPRHGEVEAGVDGCSDLSHGNTTMEGCSDNSPPYQLHEEKIGFMEACTGKFNWAQVQSGTKIIVQVVKEEMPTKGPTLAAYPKLRSRFWVLSTRGNKISISRKISGPERHRLRVIARNLKPEGFGLGVRTVAAGCSPSELTKDFEGLLSTWKDIMEHAKSAALAADEDAEGEPYVMLHSAMDQTLSIVQDYFSEKVKGMVVDSQWTYREVTNYLQEKAPDLCDRVVLYSERTPLFDKYNIEEEISNMLSKRVDLPNGGYLVIEQTEALVSVDVNSGQRMTNMLGQGTSREEAILSVNLDAAKQIARELRLRDIGGIIIVDFIDMENQSHKRRVYEEVNEAVRRDRSKVKISALSTNGIMEITRKRVRSSVTVLISEPCSYCQATGRVEALETTFSKIECEICRFLAGKADPENAESYPRCRLLVDRNMSDYLQKQKRLEVLSSSLQVQIHLKIAKGFGRGKFKVEPLSP